ncbi:MAG TPA: cytochrome C oxidase subunit IV family protein [Candidatus Binataceae bacterium]
MTTETATNASAAPHADHETNYIAIFVYLTILTGAELLVYSMNLPTVIKIGLLVALALAKATMVAMYFMHLAMERRGLWIVAATPLFLVAFCYLMLRPDLSKRAWAHTARVPGAVTTDASAAPNS